MCEEQQFLAVELELYFVKGLIVSESLGCFWVRQEPKERECCLSVCA